ncbi:hypothetical protein PROFUN_00616 [Planoprotostelium fungivorum]|uniref:PNPLA domain-containing protein n=1 Tax=Planoprotostelium fungivorum TaxID=1890364 RepID=A0A2P6NTV6_9EUKA|nr:hypothetical protein PROFUN_00616 [Planoprotostelium fungivorum]
MTMDSSSDFRPSRHALYETNEKLKLRTPGQDRRPQLPTGRGVTHYQNLRLVFHNPRHVRIPRCVVELVSDPALRPPATESHSNARKNTQTTHATNTHETPPSYGLSGFTTPEVGFAFSGAGGRVAQHSALSQALVLGEYPNATRIIPSVISGTSSGALNAVALSGYLEYVASNGSAGWSLDSWNNFIFDLENSDVYRTGIRGIIGTAVGVTDGYLLNNDPLEDTLNAALNQIGYKNLGDLFIPTFISTVDQRTGDTVRFLSTDSNVTSIPLVQILLATTAIPVAFKPRMIPALTNNTVFIDGGVSIDYLPIIPLVSGPIRVSTLYGLVPNKDPNTGNNNSSGDDLEENGIVRNILKAFEIQGNNLLVGGLAIAANSNARAFLYSAVLNQTFSTLDFNSERTQYDLVRNWARNNNPTEISEQSQAFTFNNALPSYYYTQGDTYDAAVNNNSPAASVSATSGNAAPGTGSRDQTSSASQIVVIGAVMICALLIAI